MPSTPEAHSKFCLYSCCHINYFMVSVYQLYKLFFILRKKKGKDNANSASLVKLYYLLLKIKTLTR